MGAPDDRRWPRVSAVPFSLEASGGGGVPGTDQSATLVLGKRYRLSSSAPVYVHNGPGAVSVNDPQCYPEDAWYVEADVSEIRIAAVGAAAFFWIQEER